MDNLHSVPFEVLLAAWQRAKVKGWSAEVERLRPVVKRRAHRWTPENESCR